MCRCSRKPRSSRYRACVAKACAGSGHRVVAWVRIKTPRVRYMYRVSVRGFHPFTSNLFYDCRAVHFSRIQHWVTPGPPDSQRFAQYSHSIRMVFARYSQRFAPDSHRGRIGFASIRIRSHRVTSIAWTVSEDVGQLALQSNVVLVGNFSAQLIHSRVCLKSSGDSAKRSDAHETQTTAD